MYIIYLYIIYILFMSLVRLFKNSSQTGRRMYVTTLLLLVTCYLLPLIVKIAPAQAASSGEQTCGTTLLLLVTCYLLPLIVKIAPAHGCLVGTNRHVLRPYC